MPIGITDKEGNREMNEQFQFEGDAVEVDGITYTLGAVGDPDMSIMDEQGEGVWCGRLEWTRNGDNGPVRPDDFSGRAEVFDRYGRNTLWWEVPADVAHEPEMRRSLRMAVDDCYRLGYAIVTVESSDGETDTLGGVDWSGVVEVGNEMLSDMVDRHREHVADVDRIVNAWATLAAWA